MNIHINIEHRQPRGFAPGPPRLRRDRIFHTCHVITQPKPKSENVRCVPQRPAGHRKCITQQLTMRFHPQSVFGKAWYAHYAAAGLASKTYDEQQAEYNRFSAEWQARDWQAPPPTTARSLDTR
jgi:hypothetical protein